MMIRQNITTEERRRKFWSPPSKIQSQLNLAIAWDILFDPFSTNKRGLNWRGFIQKRILFSNTVTSSYRSYLCIYFSEYVIGLWHRAKIDTFALRNLSNLITLFLSQRPVKDTQILLHPPLVVAVRYGSHSLLMYPSQRNLQSIYIYTTKMVKRSFQY